MQVRAFERYITLNTFKLASLLLGWSVIKINMEQDDAV